MGNIYAHSKYVLHNLFQSWNFLYINDFALSVVYWDQNIFTLDILLFYNYECKLLITTDKFLYIYSFLFEFIRNRFILLTIMHTMPLSAHSGFEWAPLNGHLEIAAAIFRGVIFELRM